MIEINMEKRSTVSRARMILEEKICDWIVDFSDQISYVDMVKIILRVVGPHICDLAEEAEAVASEVKESKQ